MSIAGKHFVTQREAIEGHHERDAHLLAVGTMITRIAALRLWVRRGLALKICARHIIEQHLVLDCKQFSAALRQMRLKIGFGRQQMIETAIKAILVDLLVAELQQIAKRRAAIPIFRNVQLARWLTKPRRDQHSCHLRPRDALLADRQQSLAQILKSRSAPQGKRKIHIAEPTRAFDAKALQPHRYRQALAAVIEKTRLLRSPDQPTRQRPRLYATLLIKFTQMSYRLLNNPTTNTNAAHQAPIAVDHPVLLTSRMAQIHAPKSIRLAASRKYPGSPLHAEIALAHHSTP